MPTSRDAPEAAPSGSSIPTDPKQYRKFVRQLHQRAEYLDRAGKRLMVSHGSRISDAARRELASRHTVLHERRTSKAPPAALLAALESFDDLLETHLGRFRKTVLREYVEAILWAVLLTLVIRAFVFEAFKIPTGSMIPTLQISDHLFVNKFLYGLKIPFTRIKFFAAREPRPGEVVVFEYPYDDDEESTGKDLIKRVIGVAGDKVRLVDSVIHINDKPIAHRVLDAAGDCGQESAEGWRCVVQQECLGGIVYTTLHHVDSLGLQNHSWPPPVQDPVNYGPHASRYSPPENQDYPNYVVPRGFLLVMGDNRDNSKDGRFFGLVPLDTVKGKAGVNWYATDHSRIGTFVHAEAPGGDCENF